jgi:polyisoprenoid-binding protein YceI
VAKPVTVDFELTGAENDPSGNFRVGFEGQAIINRTDWGASWNAVVEGGGILVSEKVTLEFDIAAIRHP